MSPAPPTFDREFSGGYTLKQTEDAIAARESAYAESLSSRIREEDDGPGVNVVTFKKLKPPQIPPPLHLTTVLPEKDPPQPAWEAHMLVQGQRKHVYAVREA